MREREDFPRWIDSDSDASPELRTAVFELSVESGDSERIARLETQFATLFGPAFGSVEGASGAAPTAGAPSAGLAAGASPALSIATKLGVVLLLGGGAVAVIATPGAKSPATDPKPAVVRHTGAVSEAPPRPVPSAHPALRPPDPAVVEPAREPSPSPARPLSPPTSSPRGAASPPASLSAEARLLQSARAEARKSPARALQLLAEHERRFADGVLGDEREFFAIELLARSGQRERASERLERLRARNPGSPYVGIAERLLSKMRGTDASVSEMSGDEGIP